MACTYCGKARCIGKCLRYDLQREIAKLRGEAIEWEQVAIISGAEMDRLVSENRQLRGESHRQIQEQEAK